MQILDDVKPLSKKLQESIKPLKEGEVAIFRLKNAFKEEGNREDLDTGKNERNSPEWVQFSGVQKIIDPYEIVGKDEKGNPIYKPTSKIIGTWIKDYKEMRGGGQAKPIYTPIVFTKGECKVTSDMVAEYELMMRSTYNESNKYRLQMGGKKVTPKYYLVNSREVTPFMQTIDMRYFAQKMVRDAGGTRLREIATKLNSSVDTKIHVKTYQNGFGDLDKMKYEIIQLSQVYPKQIMSATPDNAVKVRVQIYDAQFYGILAFEAGSYQLDSDNKFVNIFTPAADHDKDKVDALVEYFMSPEGKEHYVLFARTLKKALNVKEEA